MKVETLGGEDMGSASLDIFCGPSLAAHWLLRRAALFQKITLPVTEGLAAVSPSPLRLHLTAVPDFQAATTKLSFLVSACPGARTFSDLCGPFKSHSSYPSLFYPASGGDLDML